MNEWNWGQHLIFFFGTGLILIGSFWAGVGFYSWLDKKRLFSAFKIQPNRYAPDKLLQKAQRLILKNQFFILLPLLFLTYPTFAVLGLNFAWDQFPVWWVVILQVAFFMLVEDWLFYWTHRTLHRPNLYKKIHKTHHEFVVSSAIASLYAHPLEFIVSNCIPSMVGPMLLCLLGAPVHIYTLWIWLFLRVLETLDGHSGYEFRFWFPHKLIYGSGATPHDAHHSRFNGNYASFFHHWDMIHGTTLDEKKRVAQGSYTSKTHTTG